MRARGLLLGAVAAVTVGLSGCGYFYPFADGRAKAAVEGMNLTDVHLERTVLGLNCSKTDQIRYKFTARNLSGQTVHGVVCMSYLKGATVRFTG
jgi:hypothetical protein